MKTIKETLEGIHWHFQVIAYKHLNKDGAMGSATEIDILEAETEEEAMNIAKSKVKRENYMLRKAWQCTSCSVQKDMLSAIRHMHE